MTQEVVEVVENDPPKEWEYCFNVHKSYENTLHYFTTYLHWLTFKPIGCLLWVWQQEHVAAGAYGNSWSSRWRSKSNIWKVSIWFSLIVPTKFKKKKKTYSRVLTVAHYTTNKLTHFVNILVAFKNENHGYNS